MGRSALLAASAVLALLLASGVALAATVNCNPDRLYCRGTENPDTIYGTEGRNSINAGDGNDKIFGREGMDVLTGDRGDDLVRAGRGADHISGDDYWLGEDENHGGPGADHIVGNYDPEKHFGGRGDDLLVDYKSDEDPGEESDVFRCGPGYDSVSYNKGDRVADDCEELELLSGGYN